MLNSKLLDVATSTPLNESSEPFHLDVFKQFEHGNQPPTKDGLKENSTQDKRHTSNVGHLSNEQHGSPLAGSIHSLSAKRQQILLDTTNSPRRVLFVTPSPIHSSSALSKESLKQGGSAPSILKSNSKLNILEPSPCAPSSIDGIVKSNLRLLESLSSRASSLHTIMEESSKGLQFQQETVPSINLEEQFSSVDLKQGKMDCNALGTPKSISSLNQDGGIIELAKNKEHKHNEKSTEGMVKVTSPLKSVHSGKKVIHHFLTSVDPVDGEPVASTFNPSSKEITLENSKDKRDLDTHYKLSSSLVNRLNEKCSPPAYQGSLSGNLKLHDQDNRANFVAGQECNSVERALSSNYLTATAENGIQSGSPLVKVNHLINSSIVKGMDERESNGLDLQKTSENLRNFPDRIAMKLQSGSSEKNIQTAVDITQPGEISFEEQMKVSSAYASPDVHRSKTEQSPRKVYIFL